jgi:NB-ARC domain/TIR domain
VSGKIFISYRRDDNQDIRWLAKSLSQHFGKDSVFYDQSTIKDGQLYPEELSKALEEAPVVLIIVGQNWEKILASRTNDGTHLDDDRVVWEMQVALERRKRNETTIFVVFMKRDHIRNNPFEMLPESLQEIRHIQKTQFIGNESQWENTLNDLIELISESPGAPPPFLPSLRGCLPPAREERQNVERHDLIDKVINILADGQSGSLAICGLPGIGKSTLAAQLFKNAEIRKLFPGGQYWISLGKDADNRLVVIQLKSLAKCLGIIVEDIGDTPEALQSSLQEYVGERKILFVFDDVWSDTIGEQIKISGLNCACVFTTRQMSTARDLADGRVIEVPKLNGRESTELVRKIAQGALGPGQTDDVIKEITASIEKYDGLPLALSILARQLRNAGIKSNRILRELKKFSAGDLHELFEASSNQLDPDTLRALRLLSALRPDPDAFGLDLFEQVTGGTPDMADELEDTGLIYEIRDGLCAGVGSIDDSGDCYGIHRTIADWLFTGLDPADAKKVWAKAASFLADRLNEIEEANSGSDYDRWYRHESPVWQQTMYDLRYYLLKAGDYEKASFILTKAWIGGFWWWGCFDQFEFCDQLMENWPADLDKEGGDLVRDINDLETIKESYPKETEGNRFEKMDSWKKVRESLQGLRARRGLDGDPTNFDNDQCDLRGLLSIFLAETYRFGERDYKTATGFYKDAVSMFSRQFAVDMKLWNLTWAQYHLADCLHEARESEDADVIGATDANSICSDAIATEKKKKDGDQEVLARLYRLRGEIDVSNGRLDAAAGDFHNAVYHAYRFQVYKDLESPSDPDVYTLKYYPKMASSVILRLFDLHDHDKNHALELALGLGKCWHEQMDADIVKQLLIDRNDKQLIEVLLESAYPVDKLGDKEAQAHYAAEVRKRLQTLRPCEPESTTSPS